MNELCYHFRIVSKKHGLDFHGAELYNGAAKKVAKATSTLRANNENVIYITVSAAGFQWVRINHLIVEGFKDFVRIFVTIGNRKDPAAEPLTICNICAQEEKHGNNRTSYSFQMV